LPPVKVEAVAPGRLAL